MKVSKEELILEAAKELFARYGLKKTTVEDIAAKAKIGKGTIYSYFKSKENIFEAFIDKEVGSIEERAGAEIENKETAGEKLKAFVKLHIKMIRRFAGYFATFRQEYMEYYGYIETIRKKYDENEKKQIAKILEEGVKRNEFEIKDIDFTAFTMLVAMKGMEFHWSGGYDEKEINSKIDTMLDILFRGIKKIQR